VVSIPLLSTISLSNDFNDSYSDGVSDEISDGGEKVTIQYFEPMTDAVFLTDVADPWMQLPMIPIMEQV